MTLKDCVFLMKLNYQNNDSAEIVLRRPTEEDSNFKNPAEENFEIWRKWFTYGKQLLRKTTSWCDCFARRSYWIRTSVVHLAALHGVFSKLWTVWLVRCVKFWKKLCATIRTKWLICNYYTIRFCGQIKPFLTCRIKSMLGIAVYGQQKIRTLFKLHLYIP